MKPIHSTMLRTLAVSLFSLTIISGPNAANAAIYNPNVGMTSTATTLDPHAMQNLAANNSATLAKIQAIDAETDATKQLEEIYQLMQDSENKTFGADVQEAFGRLIVKAFNNGMSVHSYLGQVLHGIKEDKTPLLTSAQIAYVEKEMLSKVSGEHHDDANHKDTAKGGKQADKNSKHPDAADHKDTAKDEKKGGKKGKVKKKGGKKGLVKPDTAPAGAVSAKKGKKVKKDKKGKETGAGAEITADAAPHADATAGADATADAKPAKDKKAKGKKGKKGKETGAGAEVTVDAAPHADATAPADAVSAKKGKKFKKGKKYKKVTKTGADAADIAPATT